MTAPDSLIPRHLPDRPDLAGLAGLLELQAGVLSRDQALEHGLTRSGIEARLRTGRRRRVHHRVYATLTGDLDFTARSWAALLYCGRPTLLSHETAAVLHGLRRPAADPIHVTVPASRKLAPQPGLVVHRSRRFAALAEPGVQPARTCAAETVLDLVDRAPRPDDAVTLVAQACQRNVTSAAELARVGIERPETRWSGAIRSVLADVAGGAHSVLELRYRRRVEQAHRLPSGSRQRLVRRGGGREWTDCCYEEFGVLVELDGRLGHEGTGAWRDMDRFRPPLW